MIGEVIVAMPNEDTYSLALRDNVSHTSTTVDCRRDSGKKTVWVESTLDKVIPCQIQISRDGANWFNYNAAFNIQFGNVTRRMEYRTISDMFFFIRVQFQAAVAPTVGTIYIYVQRRAF